MNFETWFKLEHPHISLSSIQAVLKLAEEGSTVPFIARYRKEQTGNLDEVQIQAVIDADEKWKNILKRQEFIVSEIEKQNQLTEELKQKILSTFQLDQLEDLYLPYKQKRKTRATKAKEAGLEPLAQWIWDSGHGTLAFSSEKSLEEKAALFLNPEKGITEATQAISGAQDILTERLAEMQELRQKVRDALFQKGFVKSIAGEKVKKPSKFENYFNYFESVSSLLKPIHSHRYLALRRGWEEEELIVSLGGKPDENQGDHGLEEELLKAFEGAACTVAESLGAEILLKSAKLALKSHVLPSIENEAHKALKEVADEAAIQVFAENLRKLLLASPFGPKGVLGVDPGVRTGCKLAVIDDSGKYIANTVMHLEGEEAKANAKKLLVEICRQGAIRAIAVGNGTAGRETEIFIRQSLKEADITTIPVVMVNEAGASVYSASAAAREEFPELDVTVRGAISIARRLQDPLAELVKIDPKSIGVGQYQHDVSEPELKKSLERVVDSCVNQVGVNLNTASYHLLAHVAGIGPQLAKAIVNYRGEKGLFKSRQQLLEVPRFSSKAFEQSAGFLRIPEGENPLDNTGVHPERYPLLEAYAARLSKSLRELMGTGVQLLKKDFTFRDEVGKFTFEDIIQELEKPGRDPREHFTPFSFREDIHQVEDLQPGMICPGIVTNVTNFGAFVDIGVHQDGLVHLSQLANKFVKDPRDVVSPGDRVQVKILQVNTEKKQISLSLRLEEEKTRAPKSFPPRQSEKKMPRTERSSKESFQGVAPRKNQTSFKPESKPLSKGFTNSPFQGIFGLKDPVKK